MTDTKAIAVKTEDPVTDLKALKEMIAVDATDPELKLFSMYCNRTKLDPFAKQINFIKRGQKATFQASIDGFRVVAERSNEYQGQIEAEFGPMIEVEMYTSEGWGNNKKKVALKKMVPEWARVGVIKKSFTQPLFVTAYWEEYCPNYPNQSQWIKMPRLMLAKCAEALALRKAFPNDLAGIYTDDEMAQAEELPLETKSAPRQKAQVTTKPEPVKKATAEELKAIDTVCEKYHKQLSDCKTLEDLGAVGGVIKAIIKKTNDTMPKHLEAAYKSCWDRLIAAGQAKKVELENATTPVEGVESVEVAEESNPNAIDPFSDFKAELKNAKTLEDLNRAKSEIGLNDMLLTAAEIESLGKIYELRKAEFSNGKFK